MKNLLTIFFAATSLSVSAQTVEIRKSNPKWEWNNAHYFNGKPQLKPLDWSSYGATFDKKQVVLWSLYAGAGVAFGMREAYHAEPTVFETRWGVGKKSFFGSEAWQRNYVGNTYPGRHKTEIFGNAGRDFWHTAGATSKAFMFTATFSIAIRKQPMKYKIANAVIGYGIQSLFSSMTYNALR